MKISSRTHRRAGWVALIAFLLATLMPSVALAASNDTSAQAVWVQLCTVNGPAAIPLDSSASHDPDEGAASSSKSGHCVLCFSPVCPSQVGPVHVVAIDGPRLHLPRLYYHAPRQLFAWSVSLARAPPRLA